MTQTELESLQKETEELEKQVQYIEHLQYIHDEIEKDERASKMFDLLFHFQRIRGGERLYVNKCIVQYMLNFSSDEFIYSNMYLKKFNLIIESGDRSVNPADFFYKLNRELFYDLKNEGDYR